MNKKMAAAGLAAGLVAGIGAGAVLQASGAAGAASFMSANAGQTWRLGRRLLQRPRSAFATPTVI